MTSSPDCISSFAAPPSHRVATFGKRPKATDQEKNVKIAVEFPLAPHRWGPNAVLGLARAIEEIGYDEIDLFEHVTVGLPTPTRPANQAAPELPEPLVTLSAMAAVTRSIGLGTGVLVLPQRQPALVAKQVATLDVLSGGRVRLGVGVGWQESEYESLGVPFAERGRRIEEAIQLLRLYWTEPSVTFRGRYYLAEAMAMDPKPVQPGGPPIWLGGDSEAALRRVGRLGDGWLAMADADDILATLPDRLAIIRAAAEAAGRDPAKIGLQARLSAPQDLDAIASRAAALREAGFTWTSVSMPALEGAGIDGMTAQVDTLTRIIGRFRKAVG
jgi:probable F420-dependent oxidoreductase